MFRRYNSGKLLLLVFVVYYADFAIALFSKLLEQNIDAGDSKFRVSVNCLEKEYNDIMTGKMPRSSWKSSFLNTDCVDRSVRYITVVPVRQEYVNITIDCLQFCLSYNPVSSKITASYECPNKDKKISLSKIYSSKPPSVNCSLPYATSFKQFFGELWSYTPKTYLRISALETTWFLTFPPEFVLRESPAVIKYHFNLNLGQPAFSDGWNRYSFDIYVQFMPYSLNDRCRINPRIGMSAASWFSVYCSDLSAFTKKDQFYYSLYYYQRNATKYILTKKPLTRDINSAFQLPILSQSTEIEVSLYVFNQVSRACFETKAFFVITGQPFVEAKSLDAAVITFPSKDQRINFNITTSLVQRINEYHKTTSAMLNTLSPSELHFRLDKNAWRRGKMLEKMVNLKPANETQDDELIKLIKDLTSTRSELKWFASRSASLLYEKMAVKVADRPSPLSAKNFTENLLRGIGSLVEIISEDGTHFAGKTNKTVTSSFADTATTLMKSAKIIGQGLFKVNKFASGDVKIGIPDMLFSLKTSKSNEICTSPMNTSLLSHSKLISATFSCSHYPSPNVTQWAISSLYALKNPFAIFDLSQNMNFPILSVDIFDEKFNKMEVKSVAVKYYEPKITFNIEWVNQTLRFISQLNGTYRIPTFEKSFSIPLIEATSPATSLRKIFIDVIEGPFEFDVVVQYKEKPTYQQLITKNFTRDKDIKVLNNNNQNYTIIIPNKGTGNDTYYIMMVPLQKYTTQSVLPFISAKQNDTILVHMKIGMLGKSCFYWDIQRRLWSTDNCIVMPEPPSDINTVRCECNHLSIMTANLFVLPNMINLIEDVQLFAQLFENPIIFATMIYMWMIYVCLFYWCHRKDQANKFLSIITVLGNDLTGHVYFIGVRTRWLPRAGTTARVFLILFGSEANSSVHYLRDTYKACFRAGDENWFLLTTEQSIGELQGVSLWHDNSGTSPDWKLDHVIVQDFWSKKIWVLHCPDWISTERGLKSRHVLLAPLTLEELRSKRSYHFRSKIVEGFRNSHEWLGALLKTPSNRFTHKQRLMCTFNLLLSIMLGNIMFYGIPTDDPMDEIFTGISIKEFVISIETSIVIIPIGFILTKLFSCIRPRSIDLPEHEDVDETPQELRYHDNREQTTRVAVNEADANQNTGDKTSEPSHPENDGNNHIRKYLDRIVPSSSTDGCLPWWFIYIAWVVNIIYCLICTYFTVLYGLKYGPQESFNWLLSFFLSFFQSVFIEEPVVILLRAFLTVTFLVKRIKLDNFDLKIRKVSDEKLLEMICRYCHFEDEYTSFIPTQCGQRLATKMTTVAQ